MYKLNERRAEISGRPTKRGRQSHWGQPCRKGKEDANLRYSQQGRMGDRANFITKTQGEKIPRESIIQNRPVKGRKDQNSGRGSAAARLDYFSVLGKRQSKKNQSHPLGRKGDADKNDLQVGKTPMRKRLRTNLLQIVKKSRNRSWGRGRKKERKLNSSVDRGREKIVKKLYRLILKREQNAQWRTMEEVGGSRKAVRFGKRKSISSKQLKPIKRQYAWDLGETRVQAEKRITPGVWRSPRKEEV